MANVKLDKKHMILITVATILILIILSFFVFKSMNNNDENEQDSNVPSTNVITNSDNTKVGNANSQNKSSSNINKMKYTNAQVMAVLIYLLGPLPQDYTATVKGMEIKNGTNYYKINLISKSDPKDLTIYYVDPENNEAFMLDSEENSLVQVIQPINPS